MQGYVCGFFVSTDRSHVVLIRKRRPAWQAGRLNGVGGKIEPGESPPEAMIREFQEEAGLTITAWRQGVELTGVEPNGGDWRGHFFVAYGDVDATRSMTDEQLEIHPIRPLPTDMIPNLNWIIPLLLDNALARGEYAGRITSI